MRTAACKELTGWSGVESSKDGVLVQEKDNLPEQRANEYGGMTGLEGGRGRFCVRVAVMV